MGSKAMPKTKADVKLGMKHLERTIKLEQSKISDHRKAAQAAKKAGNKGSMQYNLSHLKGHQADIKDRQKAYKKYRKVTVKAAKKAGKS